MDSESNGSEKRARVRKNDVARPLQKGEREAVIPLEEREQNILNRIEEGYYETDLKGTITFFNSAFSRIFGYPEEELLSANMRQFTDEENAEKGFQAFNKVYLSESATVGFDWEIQRKDGTTRTVESSTSLIRNSTGEKIGFRGIVRDITERKKAEEALKESKERYRSFAQIGLALSIEKNIDKLLEIILQEARDLSNADAGTLYYFDKDELALVFKILQNDSLGIRMGGTSGIPIDLPNVPLYCNEQPNHANVSSHVALTGEIINIPDVYEAQGFDFTGPRRYDESTGYRSKSMLVIPMKDHENEIIGVLQLLNSKDYRTGEVIPFPGEYVDLVASLASQAAVALTNAQLIQDLRELFYAFIKSIATAIDAKSPYTGGHINRVVNLTMMIAEKINQAKEGPFKDIHFSPDEMEELRLAAWMHDVGKITTPEYIIDKGTKLQSLMDRIDLVEARFNLIIKSIENDHLRRKIARLAEGADARELQQWDQATQQEIEELKEAFAFIRSCNEPGEYVTDEKLAHLEEIARRKVRARDEEMSCITEDELKNLKVRKGTLTEEDRKIIENHATMTLKILEQLPFPKKLCHVPEYAGSHHEKLDGSGYPRHLTEADLPLQSRIMALADIFEALTAKDRPYKKPMKLSQAIGILERMKEDRFIDPDLFDLFCNERLHIVYANEEMSPEQNDLT